MGLPQSRLWSNKGHNYRQNEEHIANHGATGGERACPPSPCVGPPSGLFVFVAVCGRRGSAGKLCPLDPHPQPSLRFIQITFLMGFIGATME